MQSAQNAVNALEQKPQAVKDAEDEVTANEAGTTKAEQDISRIEGQISTKTTRIDELVEEINAKQEAADTALATRNSKYQAKQQALTAKTNAKEAYDMAMALNPTTPSTYEDYPGHPELKQLVDDALNAQTKKENDLAAAVAAQDEANTAQTNYNDAVDIFNAKSDAYDTAVTNYNTAKAAYEEALIISIDGAKIVLSKTSFTYNGKVQKPVIKTIDGKTLTADTDYTAAWSNASSKNVGTYTVTVTGKDGYKGTAKATYKILKAKNPLTVKAKTATVKYSKLKKKNQTLKRAAVIYMAKNQGKVTYVKSSGNKKITINKTTGKVTVKKGLKKGKYKVKVKVTAAGNNNYNKITKAVTFTVKVK